MASNTNRKIVLNGSEHDIYEEYTLNADAIPGHLMEIMSTGKARKHNVAGGKCVPLFLTGDRLQGKTIDNAVLANNPGFFFYASRGNKINALVAAAAPAIVIGDWVESAGDGTVRKFVGLTDSTGGTADVTLVAISGTYQQSEVRNNMADLAAAFNLTKGNSIGTACEAVDNSLEAAVARLAIRIA